MKTMSLFQQELQLGGGYVLTIESWIILLGKITFLCHLMIKCCKGLLVNLVGYSHYWFLNGYLGYNQIPIELEDQENTTCPYGTSYFRRMPFNVCKAPQTFNFAWCPFFLIWIKDSLRYLWIICVFRSSFDDYLHNLALVLKWCEDTNLVFN